MEEITRERERRGERVEGLEAWPTVLGTTVAPPGRLREQRKGGREYVERGRVRWGERNRERIFEIERVSKREIEK